MRMKNEEAWESQSSNDESLVTKNVFINGKMEERVIALLYTILAKIHLTKFINFRCN